MTNESKVVRKKANKDVIFVAPLHQVKRDVPMGDLGKATSAGELAGTGSAAAPAGAHLSYNGGALLANVQVYTVFWGKNWTATPALQTIMTSLNAYFKAILVSPLMDQLAEYSVPAYKIGHGSLTGTKVITAGAPVTSVSDTTIRTTLKAWIKAGTVPAPNANTLYFIYTEPNVSVIMQGSKSCSSFCGYHNNIVNGASQIYYAVMPYPSCSGCLGGLTALNALTATSSHELCEAVTDPVPGNGWYDQHNGEIGDICAWQFKTVAGYTVQMEWSNAQNKCI